MKKERVMLQSAITKAMQADCNDKYWNDRYADLIELIDDMVYEAYITGFSDTKGIHLNLSREERGDVYCREKGLRL